MAALKLGMEHVPVIVLDHLNETQKRAYVLVDNKLAENAGWEDSLLEVELAALRDADFDLSLIGRITLTIKEIRRSTSPSWATR